MQPRPCYIKLNYLCGLESVVQTQTEVVEEEVAGNAVVDNEAAGIGDVVVVVLVFFGIVGVGIGVLGVAIAKVHEVQIEVEGEVLVDAVVEAGNNRELEAEALGSDILGSDVGHLVLVDAGACEDSAHSLAEEVELAKLGGVVAGVDTGVEFGECVGGGSVDISGVGDERCLGDCRVVAVAESHAELQFLVESVASREVDVEIGGFLRACGINYVAVADGLVGAMGAPKVAGDHKLSVGTHCEGCQCQG